VALDRLFGRAPGRLSARRRSSARRQASAAATARALPPPRPDLPRLDAAQLAQREQH
jgi:hypothetical protein